MSTKKLILWILSGAIAVAQGVAQEARPNIVLLYIDDWAWNGSPVAMHPEMPNSRMPVVEMPNIERLAREGMVFQNAYGSPQCSPARACVLTGQSSARNGFTVYMNPRGQEYYDEDKGHAGFPVIGNVATYELDPETTFSIPEALEPMGYVSAHIGKWHLRGDPGDHGYVVHDGNTDNNPGNTIKRFLVEGEDQPTRLTEKLMEDPKLMFSVTKKAIGFMEDQVKAGNPFYLQISHYAMHAGSECKVATREKYVDHPAVQAWYAKHGKTKETVRRKEDPAVWLGMADDMDGRIGAVLEKIDELGIADSTYVIMVADNGYRHEFLPELTQPLHARKWWVWEGGIRVPMIVRGPDIEPGSRFTGNVVNYDFLPTFVDWSGGDPEALDNIDGTSLAPYLEGKEPGEEFLNRNLYFHYPHYRGTMPHTAVVSGSDKVLHFWGYDEIPMLFDLSADIGEVSNISALHTEKHQKLFGEMMAYLKGVGGRIPKMNPDYDPEKYRADKDYWDRVNWGPFQGKRQLDDDEREAQLVLGAQHPSNAGDRPRVRFRNPKDGDRLPAAVDLEVEVEVTDGDGIAEVKLLLDDLMVNAQGMTTSPRRWSSSGDPLLKSMKAGRYQLEVVAKDKTGQLGRGRIQIEVGDVSSTSSPEASSSGEEIYQVLLREGEKLNGGQALKIPRLGCLVKLEENGKLLVKDQDRGKLFQVEPKGPGGTYHAVLEKGQLKIIGGTGAGELRQTVWESPRPEGPGPFRLGLTNSRKLVIYRDGESAGIEAVWTSH